MFSLIQAVQVVKMNNIKNYKLIIGVFWAVIVCVFAHYHVSQIQTSKENQMPPDEVEKKLVGGGESVLSLVAADSVLNSATKVIEQPAAIKLPTYANWRTFAKPLPVGKDYLLFFERDGSDAHVWRMNWKEKEVSSAPVKGLSLSKDFRYTALQTEQGLWLIGDETRLILPSGEFVNLETKYNEPVAVVLNDQSILVMQPSSKSYVGGELDSGFYQLKYIPELKEIVRIFRGVLSYDGSPNKSGERYHAPRYGHSAITLHDGSVFMFGGDVTTRFVSIIVPQETEYIWNPKPLAPLPHERVNGAAIEIENGKVAVIGVNRCSEEAESSHSVDVYDVEENIWTSLPPLPIVACADAYGADRPAVSLTPDGSIVVGGYLENNIMVLKKKSSSTTGFASSWEVFGNMPSPRVSGVMQALSDEEIVVAGGVHRKTDEVSGCCYATSSFDLINLKEQSIVLAFDWLGAGVAQKEDIVFIGGGRKFEFTSTGQMRYTATAQLIDVKENKIEQLPSIPFFSGELQALWLDADRVVVKGVEKPEGRGFTYQQDLASSIPHSSGAMAIYSLKNKSWSAPLFNEELLHLKLVSLEKENSIFVESHDQLLRLDLIALKLEPVVSFYRSRFEGHTHILATNNIVRAGGFVQKDMISLMDFECERRGDEHCSEIFIGFGAATQAGIFETAQLISEKNNAVVTATSVPGAEKILSAVVTPDGRVIELVADEKRLSIEVNSLEGKGWEKWPLPEGVAAQSYEDDKLVSVKDPRDKSKNIIFFREKFWNNRTGVLGFKIWAWDEAAKSWQLALYADEGAVKSKPQPLLSDILSFQGKSMMSIGWNLDEPILWVSP